MEPRSALPEPSGDRPPRVLAVDDEPANLKLLAELLARWGWTVQTARNGAEALREVKTFAPDLILLDVMMPGQSGFDVAATLQGDPDTQHIPIVFLTALAADESKAQGFEMGARDYVTKPFNFDELGARLRARLREKRAEDALRARQAELRSKLVGERHDGKDDA